MKRILSKSFKILRERIKYHLFSLGKKTVTIYNWNRRGEELRPSKMASHFSFDSKSSWNFFFFSKTKVYFANVIIIDRQHDLSLIFSLKIKLPLINTMKVIGLIFLLLQVSNYLDSFQQSKWVSLTLSIPMQVFSN